MEISGRGCAFSLLLYMVSISIGVAASHMFFVLSMWDFAVIACVLSGPVILALNGGFSRGFWKGVVWVFSHPIAAIIVHPATPPIGKDIQYISAGDQFSLLKGIHDNKYLWHEKADMAYQLAASLKAESLLHLKINSPIEYWAFPLSMVLLFWGVVIFLFVIEVVRIKK